MRRMLLKEEVISGVQGELIASVNLDHSSSSGTINNIDKILTDDFGLYYIEVSGFHQSSLSPIVVANRYSYGIAVSGSFNFGAWYVKYSTPSGGAPGTSLTFTIYNNDGTKYTWSGSSKTVKLYKLI